MAFVWPALASAYPKVSVEAADPLARWKTQGRLSSFLQSPSSLDPEPRFWTTKELTELEEAAGAGARGTEAVDGHTAEGVGVRGHADSPSSPALSYLVLAASLRHVDHRGSRRGINRVPIGRGTGWGREAVVLCGRGRQASVIASWSFQGE